MSPQSLIETASREAILIGIRQILLDGQGRTAKQICLELSKQGIIVDIPLVQNVLQGDGRAICTFDRAGLTYVALPQYRINPTVISIIQRLLIQSKDQWKPLPDWVRFYIELG